MLHHHMYNNTPLRHHQKSEQPRVCGVCLDDSHDADHNRLLVCSSSDCDVCVHEGKNWRVNMRNFPKLSHHLALPQNAMALRPLQITRKHVRGYATIVSSAVIKMILMWIRLTRAGW